MEPLQVVSTITIHSTPGKIWDVLTNPEQTKKYMFGCETESDWNPGSSLLWQMQYEGKDFVAVKGNIVEIEPSKRLVYTVIDPNNPLIPDVPENYLTVVYDLAPQNGSVLLTIIQGDYNKVADGEKRYQDAYNNGEGWNPILTQIKSIAEAE